MAGIYIHIPFCKQACHYCDFHFVTSLKYKQRMLDAIGEELVLQRRFLEGQKIKTIYFGGGTPSILDAEDFVFLFDRIRDHYDISEVGEITVEANPDDLFLSKINLLKEHTPINRWSLGVQSFHEEDLRYMNRAHDAGQARRAIGNLFNAGFPHFSIDLIYGTPTLTDKDWSHNLQKIEEYKITHFSAYALTVETGTPLNALIRKKQLPAVADEKAVVHFHMLQDFVEQKGYDHYEISNIAIPGHEAVHNSGYWKGLPYLGIGPSAHSFDGMHRYANVRNNMQYMESIERGLIPGEKEVLSPAEKYNEYILTGLRTKWGVDEMQIKSGFAPFAEQFIAKSAEYIDLGLIHKTGDIYTLTRSGKLYADHIAMNLFV